ncbi:hypothetical protein OUZ56_033441 [Daphnia magna]|uniref:Uncharacterized protein n=1 Tax=Daphnia magna TaxID=35525 RepID=A0ABQ9ZY40_9CRUS|nr:hypothetical protein OUZ56_033441 [Daphnia magna]
MTLTPGGGKGTKNQYSRAGDKGPPIGGPEDRIPVNGPESWLFGRISSSAVGDVFRFQHTPHQSPCLGPRPRRRQLMPDWPHDHLLRRQLDRSEAMGMEPARVDLEIAEQLLQLAPDSIHRLRSPHLPFYGIQTLNGSG